MKQKSIFINASGEMKSLNELTYNDLKTLVDIEEGYIVEYKSTFDSSVKKKIPQIFSSFANSEGGWLIIGVDNDTKGLLKIEKERTDFDVTITNLLNKVTPKPKYECKFIKEKDEDKDGILVIYVYKGEDTPYIANGTVYIRSGSSKVPITSDRATIDTLYRRNENLQQRKEEFSSTNMDIDYDYGPLLEIYMFNRDNMNIELYKNSIDRQNLIEIKSKIINFAPKSIVYPSVDSIIIKNNDFTNINTTTLYIEMYNNSNVKIHIPIYMFEEVDKEQIIYNISKFNNNTYEDLEYYSFIDAYILWKTIYGSISGIYEILKNNSINFNDYEYLLEFNNIKDSIFYINNKEFLEHIKKNGLPIVKHNNYRTKYIYIIETVEDALHIASKLFFQIVGKMWGYFPNELIMIMKKLIEKNK